MGCELSFLKIQYEKFHWASKAGFSTLPVYCVPGLCCWYMNNSSWSLVWKRLQWNPSITVFAAQSQGSFLSREGSQAGCLKYWILFSSCWKWFRLWFGVQGGPCDLLSLLRRWSIQILCGFLRTPDGKEFVWKRCSWIFWQTASSLPSAAL